MTWHIVGCLIAREIKAGDRHLSDGGTWRNWIHWIAFLSQPLITSSYNGRD